jgi:hypothetical protein
MLADFKRSKPIKRIKSGKIFTFCSNFYTLSIIPNSYIAWVYKKIKIIKRKMADKTRTGYVKKIRYTISTTYKYYVIIKTLNKKTIVIPCQKEENADDIVGYFANETDALIGYNSVNQKNYGQRVSSYKKNKKKAAG